MFELLRKWTNNGGIVIFEWTVTLNHPWSELSVLRWLQNSSNVQSIYWNWRWAAAAWYHGTRSPSSKIPSLQQTSIFCTTELNYYPSVAVRGSIFIKIGYHSNQLFNVAEIAFIRSDWQKLGCAGFPLGHGEGMMEKSPLSLVSL